MIHRSFCQSTKFLRAIRPISGQVRSYRGGAGEPVAKTEEDLLKVALPKSESILKSHLAFPDRSTIPEASLDPKETNADLRRKRLIYRSKQRGWLEVDLLLGTWASENVFSLNESELNQFEDFVNMETIDIYNIITLRLDVPDHLKTEDGSGIVERIAQWARSHPLGKADPEQYKKVKTDAKLI